MKRYQTIGILIFVSLSGCVGLFDCADTVVKESVDPSGEYVATVFTRNCGATADLVTHVNIRKTSSAFKVSENSSVAGFDGECPIGLVWKNSRTLIIQAETSDMIRRHGVHVAEEIRAGGGHPVIKVELQKVEY